MVWPPRLFKERTKFREIVEVHTQNQMRKISFGNILRFFTDLLTSIPTKSEWLRLKLHIWKSVMYFKSALLMLFTYAMQYAHIDTKNWLELAFLRLETFFTFQGFFLVPRSLDQISLKNEKDFQHFVSIIGTGIDNKLFEKQFSRHH